MRHSGPIQQLFGGLEAYMGVFWAYPGVWRPIYWDLLGLPRDSEAYILGPFRPTLGFWGLYWGLLGLSRGFGGLYWGLLEDLPFWAIQAVWRSILGLLGFSRRFGGLFWGLLGLSRGLEAYKLGPFGSTLSNRLTIVHVVGHAYTLPVSFVM